MFDARLFVVTGTEPDRKEPPTMVTFTVQLTSDVARAKGFELPRSVSLTQECVYSLSHDGVRTDYRNMTHFAQSHAIHEDSIYQSKGWANPVITR